MALTSSPAQPGPSGGIVRRFRRTWLGPGKPYWGLLFVLPIFILFVVFKFEPILRGLRLSFFNANLVTKQETFVGLANYPALFADPLFIRALATTASYAIGTVAPLMVLSLLLAMMLNQGLRGTGFFRVLLFLPAIIPVIVVPILWRVLFHPYGLVNDGLNLLGIAGVDWLNNEHTVVPALIIPTEWRFVPLYMIVYLAGLQTIPKDLYEAAKIDGASMLQGFRWITLPLLKPTTLVVLIASVTFTVKSLVLPLIMTDGGPNNASQTLVLFIFQEGFRYFKFGYASAASIVLLVIIVIFTVASFRIFRAEE